MSSSKILEGGEAHAEINVPPVPPRPTYLQTLDINTKEYYNYDEENDFYSCKYCDYYYYVTLSKTYQSHSFRVSEYGTAIGSNGETVPTYLHACALCNYYYISLDR